MRLSRDALLGLLFAAAVAACGGPTVTDAPPGGTPTASPNVAPIASPTPGEPSEPSGSTVTLDVSLLDILPAEIDGVAVVPEPESFADAASDPSFAASVEAAVFALVVDGPDLASGVVARLRPGTYSDGLYRDWRDSYDQGACAQAGGIAGHAEAELGGGTAHITRCTNGLLVYHAWIPDRGVIVSLFSLGDRRFGERLLDGVRA